MKNALWKTAWIWTLALPTAAWAWGPEGHEIVGTIADYYLTPAARERVADVLDGRKLGDYEVASWPDIIRGDKEYDRRYPHNGLWHFVDFNVSQRYDDDFELKPPKDGQDVVTQIGRWQKELGKKGVAPARRLDALRFLVHFVGDLHQPLHCAYRYGDMGGNMIPVHSFKGRHYSFGPETELDYPASIHSTWDDSMVKELMAGRQPGTTARAIRKEIAEDQRAWWVRDEPLQWAGDSYWRARKQAYRWTNGENLPFKWARPGMDLTSENYVDSRLPVAKEQLQKAGVRLAHLLNEALDPDYVRPVQATPPDDSAAEK